MSAEQISGALPIIPYGRQTISEEDIAEVVNVLRSDWLTCGPVVERFERELAAYCGAKHAIAVSNGTAALHVAMLAAGITAGDRVLTSPNTFLASANCAEYVGAMADFVDIDSETYNLDPGRLEVRWKSDTRAVVAVDFAGLPCDMLEIARIARRHGAFVIEDAAHALGSRFSAQGREYHVGSHPWADMTTFSFHPVKTITTGEGGAITTNDDALARRCRMYRSHGMHKTRPEEPWFYEMATPGYNYRITDIQCALGAGQLRRLEKFVARRQEIVDTYRSAFADLKWLKLPPKANDEWRVAWHLFVVQIDFDAIGITRAWLMQELANKGVGSQVHYIPVHLQPYFARKYGYAPGNCPVAEAYYRRCLSLPLYPAMTDKQVALVAAVVRGIA
jgi:UDP-4-amino-4,6-dideoxy-N-acetyl-beta-L-altrosamine transaminase